MCNQSFFPLIIHFLTCDNCSRIPVDEWTQIPFLDTPYKFIPTSQLPTKRNVIAFGYIECRSLTFLGKIKFKLWIFPEFIVCLKLTELKWIDKPKCGLWNRNTRKRLLGQLNISAYIFLLGLMIKWSSKIWTRKVCIRRSLANTQGRPEQCISKSAFGFFWIFLKKRKKCTVALLVFLGLFEPLRSERI